MAMIGGEGSPQEDGGVSGRALAEMASLAWKLCEALDRELGFAGERGGSGSAMLRYSRRRLDGILSASGMRLVTYEGETWSAEIPASPLNPEEVEGNEALVDATVEPTVLHGSNAILLGKILLRKA